VIANQTCAKRCGSPPNSQQPLSARVQAKAAQTKRTQNEIRHLLAPRTLVAVCFSAFSLKSEKQ